MKNINVKRLNRILSYLYNEMKGLEDENRDLPMRWSVMHMYSSSQLAKLVAIKRNLDPELAGIIAALHDIAVVKTKRSENHAYEAKPYLEEIINTYNKELRYNLNEISEDEKDIIIEAVIHHSEKEIYTDNPYIELLKDVDSLDRFLHGVKTEGDYFNRSVSLFTEFKLPE